jgi:hypothetical protein
MDLDAINRVWLAFVYYIICPLLVISYCLEAWTGDIRIYLGAAKVAALTPGFPMTLDSVWESRFVGHRFLYYVLNMIDPFTGWLYSIWMKFIVALVMIVILYYFSKRVSERMQVSFHYPFILGFVGLFAVNNAIIFSAESHSVVIAMLMVTLLLDDRPWVGGLSGLLIYPLIVMKGLPVLLVPIVMLVVVMLTPHDYKARFYSALVGLPIVAAALIATVLYFPHFISDIFLLTRLGHLSHLGLIETIESFFNWGAGVIGFAPLIIISVVLSFILLSIVTKEHVRDLKLLLAMWLVAALYVFIISEFYYYHYFLMLIPAILTVCYFLKIYPHRDYAFIATVMLILVIFAGVVSGWSLGLGFRGYTFWAEQDASAADILSRYDILDQPVTLYLDDGSAAYYFTTRSACRYVGSLPPIWNVSGTAAYWEMRNCSLEYTGKYVIVFPPWVDLNVTTHTELSDKINSEYTKVYSNRWNIYQKL